MQNDLLEKLVVNSVSRFFSSVENILEENETDYILIDNLFIKNEKINGYVDLYKVKSLSDAKWHLDNIFEDSDEVYFYVEKTEEANFTVLFFEKGEERKWSFYCTGFTPEELLKAILTSDSPYIQLDYEELEEKEEVTAEIIIEAVTFDQASFEAGEMEVSETTQVETAQNLLVVVEEKAEENTHEEKGLIPFENMSILSAIFWILSLIFIKVGVALLKITKFVVLLFFELCGKGIKTTCLKIASKL